MSLLEAVVLGVCHSRRVDPSRYNLKSCGQGEGRRSEGR